LQKFVFEESWHLEQTAALKAQALEFLREQSILEPAEFRILHIVGEQCARAREHIFWRIAAEVARHLAVTLDDLLVVGPDGNASALQAIKANPSKPSVNTMLTLVDKLKVIESHGLDHQQIIERAVALPQKADQRHMKDGLGKLMQPSRR
jgi:hypothetical protein